MLCQTVLAKINLLSNRSFNTKPPRPEAEGALGLHPRGLECYFFFAAFALPVSQVLPFALFLDMHAIVLPSFHKRMVFVEITSAHYASS